MLAIVGERQTGPLALEAAIDFIVKIFLLERLQVKDDEGGFVEVAVVV
jgi:hypothetical protein